MVKIVVSGKAGAEEFAEQLLSHLKELSSDLEDFPVVVKIKNELEATLFCKEKIFDYYVGVCDSGFGEALTMPYVIIGENKCVNLSSGDNFATWDQIVNSLQEEKNIFAIDVSHIELGSDILAKSIVDHYKNSLLSNINKVDDNKD